MSADQCFPPKCAHKGPTRCRLTQDSCAHRPFKGECAQQKRIPRYLWPVRRAHFDESRRRERQPTKACLPPACRDTDHLPPLSVSRHGNRVFGPETPPRHIRIGTSVCVVTSGDDSPSSTAARRTSHCRMQAHPVLAVILSLLVTLLDYVQKWDIFDIVDEIKASSMTKLNGLL